MKAIVINKFGGPEVIEYGDFKDPIPGTDQFLVDVKMVGVNYADTYQIENSYFYFMAASTPMVPGVEASFVMDNKNFVGFTESGSYAEKATVHKRKMFEVPDGISEEEALAALSQGTTAYGLVNYACKIKRGDLVLINGASSGLSIILIQLCKMIGAEVIAVTSSEKKIEFVKNLNVDFACLNNFDEIEKLIASIGRKPDFIMDSYGGRSFMKYYNILSDQGHICTYGASAREGLPPAVKEAGSLKTASIFWGTKEFSDRDKLSQAVYYIFDLIKTKKIKITVGDKMELKDAKAMHEKMRNRDTIGKNVLVV
jgi:NADPH2:quinone reductase